MSESVHIVLRESEGSGCVIRTTAIVSGCECLITRTEHLATFGGGRTLDATQVSLNKDNLLKILCAMPGGGIAGRVGVMDKKMIDDAGELFTDLHNFVGDYCMSRADSSAAFPLFGRMNGMVAELAKMIADKEG